MNIDNCFNFVIIFTISSHAIIIWYFLIKQIIYDFQNNEEEK